MTAHSSSIPHQSTNKSSSFLVSAMARGSSWSRNDHGAASEATEMSRLATISAERSRRATVAAQRSRRATKAALRSRHATEAAEWSDRTAEAAQMSRRATEAAERSCRVAASWMDLSRALGGSHRRMRAMLNKLMDDDILRWAKLQEESYAALDKSTNVIRGLRDEKVMLHIERDLLRAKIAGRAKQHEETTVVLKKTAIMVRKLMDENAKLHIECEMLLEESVDARKRRIEDVKEIQVDEMMKMAY